MPWTWVAQGKLWQREVGLNISSAIWCVALGHFGSGTFSQPYTRQRDFVVNVVPGVQHGKCWILQWWLPLWIFRMPMLREQVAPGDMMNWYAMTDGILTRYWPSRSHWINVIPKNLTEFGLITLIKKKKVSSGTNHFWVSSIGNWVS